MQPRAARTGILLGRGGIPQPKSLFRREKLGGIAFWECVAVAGIGRTHQRAESGFPALNQDSSILRRSGQSDRQAGRRDHLSHQRNTGLWLLDRQARMRPPCLHLLIRTAAWRRTPTRGPSPPSNPTLRMLRLYHGAADGWRDLHTEPPHRQPGCSLQRHRRQYIRSSGLQFLADHPESRWRTARWEEVRSIPSRLRWRRRSCSP